MAADPVAVYLSSIRAGERARRASIACAESTKDCTLWPRSSLLIPGFFAATISSHQFLDIALRQLSCPFGRRRRCALHRVGPLLFSGDGPWS